MTNVREVSGVEWRRGSPERVPSPKEVKELILAMPNAKAQALATTLFLSGARITEIVGGKSTYKNKKTQDIKKRTVHGLTPERLYRQDYKGTPMWVFALEVIKHRKEIGKRFAVIPPWQNDLVDLLRDYAKDVPAGERVFPMTRQGAWRLLATLDKKNPLWCHYFRHAHVTHLIREGGMNHVMAGQSMGWKNISHLSTYSKYDITNIQEHFIKHWKITK